MGFGFRKSFKIAPGVRLNVGSKSVGVSAGVKGLRYSVNSRTGSRVTASIPNTGIYYSTTGGRSRKTPAYNRQREIQARQKEINRLNELEQAALSVDAYENTIERIHSIHKEADDPVNWIKIRSCNPPFKKNEGQIGEQEHAALEKLHHYKPNLMTKLLKQQNKEIETLQKEVFEARKKDEAEYHSWERDVKIASKVIDGDIDAYFQVIQEFNPLDDLTEFGSGFEFSAEHPKIVEIEFDVHSDKVVPKEQLSLTKTGKLSVKHMTKSKYFDIQQDYVCSCVLRIARDMFALLPLDTVYIHATDTIMDTAIGYPRKITILSVKIDKRALNKLNFNHIDCSDSMQNFLHNMKFKKTTGFGEVEKLKIDY
ncbi:hypothetical protein BABA_10581 [Neobacillus bataviensis LMG 21833]|uniref:DUF4236 domain-containing protein n=1 Tax=Neobacillus bataviensis LMG 21833 TaxID=1117379 RepID=K6D9U0_9BACI|nr:DUF4236 domain-containing protein [Neobacillus bataviensis]EKN69302.1 hypothetical protein BABA_10581 [Neobacillus bataviensis LMG 21833]